MPEKLNYFGRQAFSKCESLTSITIPEGITRLYGQYFSDCGQLHFAIIPQSMQVIQGDVFPSNVILHFYIKNQMFSVPFTSSWFSDNIVNAMCQPEKPENTDLIIRDFVKHNDSGNLEKFLECGFVTDQKIDDYIQFAIQNQKYESQVVLMDYKHKHIGYQPKNWDL